MANSEFSWDDYFEKCLNKFKLGDIYLDGFYHPTVCLRIDIDYERKDIGLEGVSLLDGSWPRGCSVVHSGPDKITCEEAWNMKEEYECRIRPREKTPDEIMRYVNGREVMSGDKVRLGDDEGMVTCLMDRNKSPSAFGENIWEGYRNRVVIRFSKRGFVHYIGELGPDIELVSETMKYADGQQIRLGDRVKLGKDENGKVVCLIEVGEYLPGEDWLYLKEGIMTRFPQFGHIHYKKAEEDLQLIARAGEPPK